MVEKKTKPYKNSRTTVRAFRITYTQDSLLDREQSASAVVRTLLSLYFNKKISGIDVLIKQEIQQSSNETLKRKIA